MAMVLFQPVEGSVGWSANVNTNWQTIEDFCNDVGGALRAAVPVMIGDHGAGGAQGSVPAQAAGDASKFLRGDGAWVLPVGISAQGNFVLSGGQGHVNTGVPGIAFALACYLGPGGSSALPIRVWLDGGNPGWLYFDNGDVADNSSVVQWVAS